MSCRAEPRGVETSGGEWGVWLSRDQIPPLRPSACGRNDNQEATLAASPGGACHPGGGRGPADRRTANVRAARAQSPSVSRLDSRLRGNDRVVAYAPSWRRDREGTFFRTIPLVRRVKSTHSPTDWFVGGYGSRRFWRAQGLAHSRRKVCTAHPTTPTILKEWVAASRAAWGWRHRIESHPQVLRT